MPTSIDPLDYKNTILANLTATPVGTPRDYTAAYGGIPTLPAYTETAATTIGPDVQAQMIANLPNYQAMVGQDVANITSNLGGRVPADVLNELQTRAAERGIMMGSPGAPAANASYLRALGLTSLQLQQLGNQQLTQAMARTPVQQMQTVSQVQPLTMERAQYAAAPSPAAAAAAAIRQAQQGIAAGRGSVAMPQALSYQGTTSWGKPTGVAPSTDWGLPNILSGGGGGGEDLYASRGLTWNPASRAYEPTVSPAYTPFVGGAYAGGELGSGREAGITKFGSDITDYDRYPGWYEDVGWEDMGGAPEPDMSLAWGGPY